MSIVFDFHTHPFPVKALPKALASARQRTRAWAKPFTSLVHGAHLLARHLPDGMRDAVERVGTVVPLAGLLIESSADDLKGEMAAAGVDRALVIAHPPYIPNEFVLDLAATDSAFVAAVNVPAGTQAPAERLREFAQRGARVLKIHAAADGEGVNSPRYRELLETAQDLGLVVVIHTGCLRSTLVFKDPSLGHAEIFKPWFKMYPRTRFVLAHMNDHRPNVAIELAEDFPNVLLDTSWQPAEIIGEAVRRAGAERVLFATDWPIVGNNLAVGRARIDACVAKGSVTEAERERILGENALRILGLHESDGTGRDKSGVEAVTDLRAGAEGVSVRPAGERDAP